ncbi:hypothetical protein ACH4XT_01470 [Streptomyces avidinii]|uniref:hypothetical protein n=1 Tax=Streptomyces avidinii TaxID=1895 RepID=UPI00379F4254
MPLLFPVTPEVTNDEISPLEQCARRVRVSSDHVRRVTPRRRDLAVLTEGVRFLYDQAGALLARRRERAAEAGAAEENSPAPPVVAEPRELPAADPVLVECAGCGPISTNTPPVSIP